MLLLVLHHIAGDGWSLAPLARDLARCLCGALPGHGAGAAGAAGAICRLHAVAARGSGRGERCRQSAIARQLAFWTETLKELPDQIDLPTRPAAARGVELSRATACRCNLAPSCTAVCWRWRATSGASLFMVLQAGLAALLTRLGAGTDIPIGSPIAGRTDSALDDLVGFFVNTLVLRTDTSGNPSFRELIARVRASNLSAYSHQDLPFERLVEVLNPARSLSRHPLFQVMLALQNNAPVSFELPGLVSAVEPVATASAKFDLSLSLGEQRAPRRHAGGIDGVLEYATDLFDRASVEALAERLVRLLEAAVAEPERAIGGLDILTADGARHHPARSGTTPRVRSRSATLPELFAAQVARTPDAIAVVFEDEQPQLWRARCARQPAGASSARVSASAPRWWWGCAWSARSR